ncbi:alpha/beta hydrolase [Flavobacterium sp.]|uniref:alpha/beta hydrolase n=1 Tax=Flavobacterium sp. TaxID=239 RepID=UPI00262EBDAD|nr:alpha/beta hydrolase [Flavobacterium sp.]
MIGFYINILSFLYPKKSLELAYQFFSEPREGRLSPKNLPEILKEATLEVIEHNGHFLQTYIWKGNENKILLIHGWESNAARWEKLLDFLKKSGSTIIALDGPAHGLSSGKEFNVPTYAEFINVVSEKHKPKFIIGHSMGGVACAYYQHLYQNHDLEKMILLGSPSDFKILLDNYSKMLSLNSKVYEQLVSYIKKRFKIDIDEFTSVQFLKNTTINGIIAHDAADDVVAFEEAKKMAQSWKKAKFIETQGLGHSLHDDKLYQNIYQFLFEVE